MALRNGPERFGAVSKAFHWGMAAMVIPLWILGYVMVQPTQDLLAQYELYQLHKSFGFVVFGLGMLRLLWRSVDPAPPLPPSMHPIQRTAAQLAHLLLYGFLITLPVTGFLMSAASPLAIPTVLFDTVPVPHPIGPSEQTYAFFRGAHYYLAMGLATVLVIHVLGAIQHTLIGKDSVLQRMLPFVR
ncbi:MAG TPA: cytochrome b [Geminicoccus sp.]|jgi:cytochrome b561|uniref:cytochrome b n=1 Tax=Geminicoccus sp. TaxID=2024832 RepID=UPI002E34A24A|nr:cytochrome b [Geminicoccus sp.]HEX2528391.1 cytochrome b [Geminicoccus sp.]